ncbi:MAG: hypothetical protein C0173_02470 [Desulfurella sp.]|uniref:hypothetical protein n=1 Tax=Desulfurella sp. TaxID=1962857 RepID=UPI000CB6DB3C|nr:hypothetical protein [Desulfurella sp.]PMP92223.1 MAG: hypothetical protein C0173_02470 [Desulfurella sp.]
MLEFKNDKVGKVKVEFVDRKWRVVLQNNFEFFVTELIEIDGVYHIMYTLEHFEDVDDIESIIINRIFIPIPQQIYEKMQAEKVKWVTLL